MLSIIEEAKFANLAAPRHLLGEYPHMAELAQQVSAPQGWTFDDNGVLARPSELVYA